MSVFIRSAEEDDGATVAETDDLRFDDLHDVPKPALRRRRGEKGPPGTGLLSAILGGKPLVFPVNLLRAYLTKRAIIQRSANRIPAIKTVFRMFGAEARFSAIAMVTSQWGPVNPSGQVHPGSGSFPETQLLQSPPLTQK